MNLDAWTIGLQAANFLILVALLHRLLYRPVKRVLAEREAAIADRIAEADAAAGRAAALESERRAQLDRVDDERDRRLADARALVDDERSRILDAARADAEALAAAVRKELAKERREAYESLREDAAAVAVQLAARLLRQVRDGALLDAFFDRVVRELEAMPRPRGAVRVATAPELDAGARDRWAARLRALLGDVDVTFDTDDALVAGVELRAAHTVLRFAWADALAQARRELEREADAA